MVSESLDSWGTTNQTSDGLELQLPQQTAQLGGTGYPGTGEVVVRQNDPLVSRRNGTVSAQCPPGNLEAVWLDTILI